MSHKSNPARRDLWGVGRWHSTDEGTELRGPTREEGREGRRPTEENIGQPAATQTQSRNIASRGLDGVREAARKDQKVRFTTLLHHVTVDLLRAEVRTV